MVFICVFVDTTLTCNMVSMYDVIVCVRGWEGD